MKIYECGCYFDDEIEDWDFCKIHQSEYDSLIEEIKKQKKIRD